MSANTTRAALLAALAAISLAACDRGADTRTAGQKLDSAVAKTEEKLNVAGDKIAAATDKAVEKTKEVAADVKSSTIAATNDVKAEAKEATADAKASDTGRAMTDTAITASVKTDFLKDPDLSVLKIDVDTKDGVVTLNGLAGTEPARQRAEKMAQSVKGVKEVRNFLVVKRA